MTDLVLTQGIANTLEEKFLSGLEDAQSAYEQIVALQAWTALGFDSLGAWWDARVRPMMTALSMKPTREIAAAVIEQVRAEEAELPPTWRRTQAQLAEMVGVTQQAISARSFGHKNLSGGDLDEPSADESTTTTAAIDDVPLWDDEPQPEPEPYRLPARQELADRLTARIDEALARDTTPAPKPAPSPNRDEQTSREVASKNLARCVWTLAGFAATVDAAALMAKDWQPGQDIYPLPTTAERIRVAADYLYELAERWPQ